MIFLVAAQAELTQTPFDMPVAESELVAGYHDRVHRACASCSSSSAEFGTAFAFAAIAATLFLGGWYFPGVAPATTGRPARRRSCCSPRSWPSAFLIFWVRFTYPRFREDQLQTFAWKYLIPLSLVNIAGHRHPEGGVLDAQARPRRHQGPRRHASRRCSTAGRSPCSTPT